MRKLRKGAAALLCVLMLVGLLPITALAAVGMQNDTPTFMVNDTDTVIHFAGHEWYVIDTGTNGVTNPGSGSLTLLAKSSFGTSARKTGSHAIDTSAYPAPNAAPAISRHGRTLQPANTLARRSVR